MLELRKSYFHHKLVSSPHSVLNIKAYVWRRALFVPSLTLLVLVAREGQRDVAPPASYSLHLSEAPGPHLPHWCHQSWGLLHRGGQWRGQCGKVFHYAIAITYQLLSPVIPFTFYLSRSITFVEVEIEGKIY